MEATCARMGEVIGSALPPGTGFALILTDFGAKGNMAYCSNANRKDMITLMRETADHIEGN